jgi:hypothetical protein
VILIVGYNKLNRSLYGISGTYGCVYKALHKQSREMVALKKVVNVPKEEGVNIIVINN